MESMSVDLAGLHERIASGSGNALEVSQPFLTVRLQPLPRMLLSRLCWLLYILEMSPQRRVQVVQNLAGSDWPQQDLVGRPGIEQPEDGRVHTTT